MMTRSTSECSNQTTCSGCHRVLLRLAHSSLGFLLLALPGCANLPNSLKLPDSIALPDILNLPITPIRKPDSSKPTPQIRIARLKLGTLFSWSGNLGKYGSTMQDSTQLLVETVNSCGGVLNQSVQLLAEDDRSTVETGKQGMNQLAATEQVGAVIGAIGSEVSNATASIAAQHRVVQISPASASPVLTERAKKGDFQGFWFRTMPSDSFQGEALAQLAHQRGFKSVSVLTSDTDYGKNVVQSFEARFKQLGGTLTAPPSRFSPYANSYNIDYITTFGNAPDAVLLVAEPELGGAILRAASEQGFLNRNVKILLPSSMKTDSLAGQVGQSIDGRYIASNVLGVTPMMGSPATTQFREIYKNRFGREPNLYDPNTWDAAAVAVLAAEAAKNSTGTALKSKIHAVANPPGIEVSDVCQALAYLREGKEINYQGAGGAVDFNSVGDTVANYSIWTIDYTGKVKIENSIQVGKPLQEKAGQP